MLKARHKHMRQTGTTNISIENNQLRGGQGLGPACMNGRYTAGPMSRMAAKEEAR